MFHQFPSPLFLMFWQYLTVINIFFQNVPAACWSSQPSRNHPNKFQNQSFTRNSPSFFDSYPGFNLDLENFPIDDTKNRIYQRKMLDVPHFSGEVGEFLHWSRWVPPVPPGLPWSTSFCSLARASRSMAAWLGRNFSSTSFSSLKRLGAAMAAMGYEVENRN